MNLSSSSTKNKNMPDSIKYSLIILTIVFIITLIILIESFLFWMFNFIFYFKFLTFLVIIDYNNLVHYLLALLFNKKNYYDDYFSRELIYMY